MFWYRFRPAMLLLLSQGEYQVMVMRFLALDLFRIQESTAYSYISFNKFSVVMTTASARNVRY